MEQRSCENCIYYRKHYTKRALSFYPTSFGHCVKKLTKCKFENTSCELYVEKDIEQEKQQQIKTICQYLSSVDKRLKEIKQVLSDN